MQEIFDVEFSPSSGTLTEKQELTATLTYTARKAGKVDTLFSLDIDGMEFPLGFRLRTVSKGLLIHYSLRDPAAVELPAGAALGEGWQDENPPREGAKEPNTRILPTIDFGKDCPLMGRRRLQLTIRNYSGIDTTYSLSMQKYPGAEKKKKKKNSNDQPVSIRVEASEGASAILLKDGASRESVPSGSRAASRARSSRLRSRSGANGKKGGSRILDNAHESSEQFRSEKGHEYILEKTQKVLDQEILRKGRGVAFVITPARGSLPAWGTATVDVVCYNDMPGKYSDELISHIEGVQPLKLRTKVKVVGTPSALRQHA